MLHSGTSPEFRANVLIYVSYMDKYTLSIEEEAEIFMELNSIFSAKASPKVLQ